MTSPITDIIVHHVNDSEIINTALKAAFDRAEKLDQTKGTHFLGGRYENTYVELENIPEVQQVIDAVITHSAEAVGAIPCSLKAGYWFNKMQPGHETLPHTHDDFDELVSAVYYIHIPENSGELVLERGKSKDEIIIHPEEGMLVMFPPSMKHWVTKNLSNETRLSVALNLGTGGWGASE